MKDGLIYRLQFRDDFPLESFKLAIQRQLTAYASMDLTGEIKFGKTIYPKSILKSSIILLNQLIDDELRCLTAHSKEFCLTEFSLKLNQYFSIYLPQTEQSRYTVYYSPDVSGSRTRSEKFSRPVYKLPTNPQGKNFTRVDIDYHEALAGDELFWLTESFFDIYLLHIEGGGRIKIHKYMLEHNLLEFGKHTIPYQRTYLEEHPEQQEEIFSSAPFYVFFEEDETEPVGLNKIPLTPKRSLAIDKGLYPTTGLISFVKLEHNSKKLSRFFLAQDTGGAIKGAGRSDLYLGFGQEAVDLAYTLDTAGEQYFLIKKVEP